MCVAIVRPSHEGCAGGRPASISPETAVDGLPEGYGGCAKGLILKLKNDRNVLYSECAGKVNTIKEVVYENSSRKQIYVNHLATIVTTKMGLSFD